MALSCFTALRVCVGKKHRAQGINSLGLQGFTNAERIARVTLELGGKSAAIVADDIDLDALIPALVNNGILLSGKICAALTRVLIHRNRQAELTARMARYMASMNVGDPFDPETQILSIRINIDRPR